VAKNGKTFGSCPEVNLHFALDNASFGRAIHAIKNPSFRCNLQFIS
jgi:hypothetical protein